VTPTLLQVLVVVDVQGAVNAGELAALLPDQRDERRILSLCDDGGAPRVVRHGTDAAPIDWIGLARAVERVAAIVREASERRILHLYIGGQAPLPVFAHLGYVLSKFAGTQWLLARRQPGAPLERFSLASTGTHGDLLVVHGLPAEPSPAAGEVAVYIDVLPRDDPDALRAAVAAGGGQLTAVVRLLPETALTVDPDNVGALAAELDRKLTQLAARYRHAAIGLFLGGPTSLAFLAGRAVNPNVVATTTLYDHHGKHYAPVYTLPFDVRSEPALPDDPASVAARADVDAVLRAAIESLQVDIAERDLAAALAPAEQPTFLRRFVALRHAGPDRVDFSLSLTHGTFSFGAGLLEALRHGAPDHQRRLAILLVLHELFHDRQDIRSTSYFEIGRAGVVLEAVDFAADVFALRVATSIALRRLRPSSSPAVLRDEAVAWFDAVLYGIQAFDQWQHGTPITDLADRRLRRYLTWHLQRVRAETIESADDLGALLTSSLTVELAPVRARLEHRFDRQVLSALPSTELFAAIDGRLIRRGKQPGFEPGSLIDAVRTYDSDAIRSAMRYVVGEARALLVPWRP
jgi:hypothetical protein